MAIQISFRGSPKSLISKVKDAVKDNGGSFSGDEDKGKIKISTLLGEIRGAYNIKDDKIRVEILKKPFFVSEEKIMREIKKMIKS
jgi:hypothetical protein